MILILANVFYSYDYCLSHCQRRIRQKQRNLLFVHHAFFCYPVTYLNAITITTRTLQKYIITKVECGLLTITVVHSREKNNENKTNSLLKHHKFRYSSLTGFFLCVSWYQDQNKFKYKVIKKFYRNILRRLLFDRSI